MRQAAEPVPRPPGPPPRAGAAEAPVRPPPRLSVGNPYSMFVGLMKVVLPAMAAALILLVIAWPKLMLEEDRFRVGVSLLSPDQVDNLSMLNARFEGIDEKSQPYTITANMASQSGVDEDLVDLDLPKADITLADGTWLALTARTGQYRREGKQLDLHGSVSLFHDKGFELRSEFARIDLAASTAEGDRPVEGQGAAGRIHAEGFRVLDRGQRIVFTGKSRLVIYPDAQEQLR